MPNGNKYWHLLFEFCWQCSLEVAFNTCYRNECLPYYVVWPHFDRLISTIIWLWCLFWCCCCCLLPVNCFSSLSVSKHLYIIYLCRSFLALVSLYVSMSMLTVCLAIHLSFVNSIKHLLIMGFSLVMSLSPRPA